jgi:hypothetical protein
MLSLCKIYKTKRFTTESLAFQGGDEILKAYKGFSLLVGWWLVGKVEVPQVWVCLGL